MPDSPFISLLMPCFNRAYDLAKTLQAYEAQRGDEPFELIAVDDGSGDGTYQVLSAFQPTRFSLRVERLERNSGPAAARNRGLALATAPLVLFVGDDILPDPNLVSGHLAAHRHYPRREDAVLGRVAWGKDLPVNTLMEHIDGVGAQQFSYYYLKDGQQYDFRHLYTANISLKRDFLLSLDHLFDTDFQYAAFEDVELSYRLSLKGLRIFYSYPLLGYHYHYHTIWTFSTRQYRSGLMATVLVKKHPEPAPIIMGKRWRLRTKVYPLLARLQPARPGIASVLEEHSKQLLSAFEWSQHPLLDGLYRGVLRYFYFKGLIAGEFGEAASVPIQDRFARRVLAPLLSRFYHESRLYGEQRVEAPAWLSGVLS